MRSDAPGRTDGRRNRWALLGTALLALLTVMVVLAAPASAKPEKVKAGGGRPTSTTTVEPTMAAEPTVAEPTTSEPTVAPVAPTPPALRRAALRLAVTTSSDWVQIDLPGISAGHVTVEGTRSVRPTDRGIVVSGPAKVTGSVTVDVVTEVAPELAQAAVTVAQGGAGKSTVQVLNRTGAPYEVTTIGTDWATTKRTAALTADALMGSEQLQWTRADDQRRVLAFIYPWFSGDWVATSPDLTAHPTSTWKTLDAASALVQAEQARANGIDGFVMSFSGAKSHGLPLANTLAAAERTGGTATVLLETSAAASAAEAEQWLVEALQQSSSPAFMRLGGVPVVFTFATGTVPATRWQAIADRLTAAGTPVEIVSDTWSPDGHSAGLYRYNALLQTPTDPMTTAELTAWNQSAARRLRARATLGTGSPGVVVATVQPGWHRLKSVEGEVPVPRDGTATFDATWQAALDGEPDWVVVTSWNEWYEGTGIAPSVEYGTTALEATSGWAARFRG